MPWSIEDVEEHKKGLDKKQKEQWVAVANSVLKKCLADGGTDKTCAPKAIRQANGVVGNNEDSTMNIHSIQTDVYQVKSVTHQGRQHMVVPVVMMKEGVHAGSHGELLHPAAELGKFVDSWNGIPIVVHHPKKDGQNVSANSPDLVDTAVVGRVYNSSMDGDKLRAEAWIDVEKLRTVSPVALGAIHEQRPLDVSVGVFTDDDLSTGEWNGEAYVGIARNHRPDHLALLPGGKGACSWSDGCGIRANEYTQDDFNPYHDKEGKFAEGKGGGGGDKGGGDREPDPLTKEKRDRLDSEYISKFKDALDDPKTPGATVNLSEGVALSLQTELSSRGYKMKEGSENSKARESYWINSKQSTVEFSQPRFLSQGVVKVTLIKRAEYEPTAHGIIDEQGMKNNELTDKVIKDLAVNGSLIQINQPQGFKEIICAMQTKLNRMDDDIKVHFLQEVFKDYVIYEVRRTGGMFSGPDAAEGVLYSRDYKINGDGSIEFTGEPVVVRRETKYVNAQSAETERKETIMAEAKKPCCPEKVLLLVQSENSPWKETDREFLESLDDGQLTKLVDQTNMLAKLEEEEKEAKVVPITKEQVLEAIKEMASTPEQAIEFMPEAMREGLMSAHNEHQARRSGMIKQIMANSQFTEDELKARPAAELDKLASMIPKRADYSGQAGGSSTNKVDVDDILFPPGVEVYDEKGVKVNG